MQVGLAGAARHHRSFAAARFDDVGERGRAFLDVPVTEVMHADPRVARADELGTAAVRRLERLGVMALPVLDDEDKVVGIVHLHDLMRAGAV